VIPFVFQVVIAVLVASFFAWLVGVLPFIAAPFKQIAQGVILFVVLVWLLFAAYGFFYGGAPIGHWGR
jgi:hypothetical protein